jgi:hypothetical protein
MVSGDGACINNTPPGGSSGVRYCTAVGNASSKRGHMHNLTLFLAPDEAETRRLRRRMSVFSGQAFC